MSLRVFNCDEHKVSWLHEDPRFDDPRWDPTPTKTAFYRAKCPHGHFVSAAVGYRWFWKSEETKP